MFEGYGKPTKHVIRDKYCPDLDSNLEFPRKQVHYATGTASWSALIFIYAVTMNTKKGDDANDDVLFRHDVPSHNNKVW